MPANKSALIRYKTIDKCLQNRFRKWTLDDLLDAVNDALYEYEGNRNGISLRTLQADLQMMRSDKLGYNAPIIVKDKKYYAYEDKNYSITQMPISETDLQKLNESISFLGQFKSFSHFRDLTGIIQKIEDHIHSRQSNAPPIIEFETNNNLKGLEFLDPLYQFILHKKALEVEYKSFKAKEPTIINFHPYLLKEFNNRWFLVGKNTDNPKIQIIALDRILKINEHSKLKYKIDPTFNSNSFFKDIVGVTLMEGLRIEEIIIKADLHNAPYIKTKPIHASQCIVSEDEKSTTFSYHIKINPEFERIILGFGCNVEVIKPLRLRNKIYKNLIKAKENYESEKE
ncbi:MAG: hypothetical protein RLZZ546_1481 [Bacteroidota bacterium]|jgi:hypothetical protein